MLPGLATWHVHARQGPAQAAPGVPAPECCEAGADAGAAEAASGGAAALVALLLSKPAVPGMRQHPSVLLLKHTAGLVLLAAVPSTREQHACCAAEGRPACLERFLL